MNASDVEILLIANRDNKGNFLLSQNQLSRFTYQKNFRSIYIVHRHLLQKVPINLLSDISDETFQNLLIQHSVFFEESNRHLILVWLSNTEYQNTRDYFLESKRNIPYHLVPCPYYTVDVNYSDMCVDKIVAADGRLYNVTRCYNNIVSSILEKNPPDTNYDLLNGPQLACLYAFQTEAVFQSSSISSPVYQTLSDEILGQPTVIFYRDQSHKIGTELSSIYKPNFISILGYNIHLSIVLTGGAGADIELDLPDLSPLNLMIYYGYETKLVTSSDSAAYSTLYLPDNGLDDVVLYLIFSKRNADIDAKLAYLWTYSKMFDIEIGNPLPEAYTTNPGSFFHCSLQGVINEIPIDYTVQNQLFTQFQANRNRLIYQSTEYSSFFLFPRATPPIQSFIRINPDYISEQSEYGDLKILEKDYIFFNTDQMVIDSESVTQSGGYFKLPFDATIYFFDDDTKKQENTMIKAGNLFEVLPGQAPQGLSYDSTNHIYRLKQISFKSFRFYYDIYLDNYNTIHKGSYGCISGSYGEQSLALTEQLELYTDLAYGGPQSEHFGNTTPIYIGNGFKTRNIFNRLVMRSRPKIRVRIPTFYTINNIVPRQLKFQIELIYF